MPRPDSLNDSLYGEASMPPCSWPQDFRGEA